MATANAATNYLERRLLHFIFKNNSRSLSPISIGLFNFLENKKDRYPFDIKFLKLSIQEKKNIARKQNLNKKL